MKKLIFGAAALVALGSGAMAANPVTVDAEGGGDFTTVQAAIDSWAAGGSNAGETAPFVINIDADDTFDEQIILSSAVAGQGDIVGDIVIQSDTPGTKAAIALQGEDGIVLHQEVHNVTLRDLLLYPSLTSTTSDELIKIDENSANATFNTILFDNCIITETDASGVPLVTTRAAAYNAPTTLDTGARTNTFASQIQYWGDNGESLNVQIVDTVVYGLPSGSGGNLLRAVPAGQDGESVTITDSVFAYQGTGAVIRSGGSNSYACTWTINGTDQTNGPADATVIISNPANTTTVTFEGTIAAGSAASSFPVSFSEVLLSGTNGIQAFGSAPHWDISVSDSVISAPTGIGLETNANTPLTISNVTIDSDEGILVNQGASTITVRDSIFTGGDDADGKFGGAATSTLDIDFSAIFTSLATFDPASTLVDGTGSNMLIGANPVFVSTDITSGDFYDVDNNAYGTAGTGGTPLAGGATYIGSTDVRDWMSF